MTVLLRFQLVIDVGAETVEVIVSFFPSYEGTHLHGLHILKLNDGAGDGCAGGIGNDSGDGPFRRRLFALSEGEGGERKNYCERDER